ncbi:MAG TPA: Rrf2 family transcriptional regulator [Bacteroidales bacterium]|nr:Rrf2 family transcriptional regulator [Bacteroidales bacterium]
MNFTKTSSYSLNVLANMARHENMIMSASYLHNQLEIPYSYLRSVLLDLSRKGLIKGVKGRNGGFCLGREKEDIYLSEIINATEGIDVLNKCIMGYEKCPFDNVCIFHSAWTKMRDEIIDILENTTLADHLNSTDISKSKINQ